MLKIFLDKKYSHESLMCINISAIVYGWKHIIISDRQLEGNTVAFLIQYDTWKHKLFWIKPIINGFAISNFTT
jgi:hypothetical protein